LAAGYTLLVMTAIDPSRPAAWSKIRGVARALDAGFDLVLCTDADALVMNPSLRVEELMDWSAHQTLAADHNGPNSGAPEPRRVLGRCPHASVAGVWLVRNTPWARWYCNELWAQEALVRLPASRALFHYEQRAFHHTLQTAAWRRRTGRRYEAANGVRSATALVHQCVLNTLPSWYSPGDFILHLAGIKGAARCLLFRAAYGSAAAAAGRTLGVDAPQPPTRARCLLGVGPYEH